MASIIKEKSMGRPDTGRNKISKTKPGLRLAVFYSGIWLKMQLHPLRIISYKSLSLSLLVVFSALFLIYCRTGSSGLHDYRPVHPEAELKIQNQGAPVRVPEKLSPEPEALPDLSPLLKLKAMDYDPGQLRGIFWRESDFEGQYFLTFDDGPNTQMLSGLRETSVCESILDSLAPYGYKAVFFINGKNLVYQNENEKKALRDLFLRILREGHLLGNHSYSHHNLAKGIFSDGEHDLEDIEDELVRTQTALDEILGFPYPLLLVRPPYAEPGRTDTLDRLLSQKGQFLVSLQFDSYDYAYKENGRWNSLTIGNRIISLMSEQPEGGVLLLHELDSTARMLPALLKNFDERQMHIGKLEDHLYKKYGRRS